MNGTKCIILVILVCILLMQRVLERTSIVSVELKRSDSNCMKQRRRNRVIRVGV